MKNNNLGFTLIELVLVMAVSATLFGLVMFNLIGTQKSSEVGTQADTLISDLSSQQTKAMLGAGTANGTDYGIHFDSNKYTLFKGSTYNSSDSNNFVVNIDSGYQLVNTLTNGNVIFVSTTGTVSGFLSNKNTVTVQDKNGPKTKTITVNRYGVVTGEN